MVQGYADSSGRRGRRFNIAGGDARFGGVLGTAITRFSAGAHQIEIARTGLSTAEAAAAGLTVSSLVTEGRTASGYMPEASPIATKVIAEQGPARWPGCPGRQPAAPA